MLESELHSRLTALLRRDPTDREIAFLVTLAARQPLKLYDAERRRLRRLRPTPGSERGEIITAVARRLLELSRLVRR